MKAFDCSSFISYGLHNGGGYDLSRCFTTSDMENGLKAIGFDSMRFKRSNLKRGDIVLTEGEHVEAVYSRNGDDIKLVGARTDTLPRNEQIAVHDLGTSTYQLIVRPFDSPSSKPRENPTNSNKSNHKTNPKTPNPITQNALPPTFIRRRRRGF